MRDWQFETPLDGAQAGRLQVRGGMLRLDLRGERTAALCRARFVGPEPGAYAADGRVVFDYGHFGFVHWLEDILMGRAGCPDRDQ